MLEIIIIILTACLSLHLSKKFAAQIWLQKSFLDKLLAIVNTVLSFYLFTQFFQASLLIILAILTLTLSLDPNSLIISGLVFLIINNAIFYPLSGLLMMTVMLSNSYREALRVKQLLQTETRVTPTRLTLEEVEEIELTAEEVMKLRNGKIIIL